MATGTARDSYYEVQGLPGYWDKSGGDVEKATTDVFHPGPGGGRNEKLAGSASTSNITLTHRFDPSTDADLLRETIVNRLQGRNWRTTLIGHFEDPEAGPVGKPWTYANSLLVSAPGIDADSGEGTASNFTLVFAPGLLS